MAKKIDVNGLDHYHDKVSAMLASEYSSSKTYAVGDYCFHAGTLYECTTAITTAENWTAGHWTAAKLAEDTSALKTAISDHDLDSLALMPKYQGNLSTTKTWNNINANYQHNVFPVNSGDTVYIKANSDVNLYIGVLTNYVTPVNGASVPYSSDANFNNRKTIAKGTEFQFTVPSDGKYLVMVTVYGGDDASPDTLIITGYVYTKSAKYNILKAMGETDRLKWCAMGDSITMGYYSSIDSGTPAQHFNQFSTWAALLAQKKAWSLTNVAIGATGYLFKGSNGDSDNAFEVAEDIDFTNYDVVTLAYGINDWKGNVATGTIADDTTTPTTMIAAMKKTIETILTSNPSIKIIVITPFNCRGYEFAYGDFSTNYALGYSFSNSGTLQDAFEAIVDVCDYYGIYYIDETHYSAVNRMNIETALPDGVHPSLDTHAVIAHELSGKVAYI